MVVFFLCSVDLLVEITKLIDREEKRTIKEEKVDDSLIVKFGGSLWVIGSWQPPTFLGYPQVMVERALDLRRASLTSPAHGHCGTCLCPGIRETI